MARARLTPAFVVMAALAGVPVLGHPGELRPAHPEQVGAASLPDLLTSVGAYLDQYEQDASAIVAEEDYVQQFVAGGPIPLAAGLPRLQSRTLKSDLVLVSDPGMGVVTYRDVFEVDGRAVRDRNDTLMKIFATPNANAREQAKAIADGAARFNLNVPGVSSNRTLNVPMAALVFLRRVSQSRSTFSVERVQSVSGHQAAVVSFVEQALPRLIHSANDVAAHGSAWIEIGSGRVLRTTLTYDLTTGVNRTELSITVAYGEDGRTKLWLPSTMDERYIASAAGVFAGQLTARARYSKFRQFKVDVSEGRAPLSDEPGGGGPASPGTR